MRSSCARLRCHANRATWCPLLFAPSRICEHALSEGTALLAFYCTTLETHAFLMTQRPLWLLGRVSPSAVHKQSWTARDLGNFEQTKEMRLADLQESKWPTSQDLLGMLMKTRRSRSLTA